MRKFNNYTKFLTENNFNLTSSSDDFINDNNMIFLCKSGHYTTITATSFANKKVKCKENCDLLCSTCAKEVENSITFERYKGIIAKNGHTLLTHEPSTKKCTYECGNCGEIRDSSMPGLLRKDATEYCGACLQLKNRRSITDINAVFREIGYLCTNYVNNKNLVIQCDKGHITSSLSFNDFNRGRRCPDCSLDRRIVTNLRVYGVENPMHVPEIFSKALKEAYRTKPFMFPSGNIVMIQGYEKYCLRDLLELDNYVEENIIVAANLMPEFWYIMNDRKHRYYPDVMIVDGTKQWFIEVKSEYTYIKEIEKNLLKWDAVVSYKFYIEVWVYDEKGVKIRVEKYGEQITV